MMTSPEFEPLRYPDNWPSPSRFELFCRWIPFAGWIVGAVLERRRTGPIVNELNQRFDARPPVPFEYWDDEVRQRIARLLIESCVEACCWPHSHFVPGDSFGVMMEWKTGDGCEWDAMFRIEKALDVKLSNAEWQMLCELSLQDTIDFLASRMQASPAQ